MLVLVMILVVEVGCTLFNTKFFTHPLTPSTPSTLLSGLTYSPLVTTIGLVSHLRPALRRALPTTLLACATAMHGLSISNKDGGYDAAAADVRVLFAVAVTVMEEGYQRHQVEDHHHKHT